MRLMQGKSSKQLVRAFCNDPLYFALSIDDANALILRSLYTLVWILALPFVLVLFLAEAFIDSAFSPGVPDLDYDSRSRTTWLMSLPRMSSATSGFFFWGMMDEPVE